MVDDNDMTYAFARPAPRGDLWALEASAGTGKTWTIENFVADYLADGAISPEEVVIVTFTRAATAELRSRIRKNIAAIVRGDDADAPHRNYTPAERAVLRDVLAAFGQIRISTIHGFAQRALAALGEPLGQMTVNVDSDEFRRSVLSDVVRGLPAARLAELVTNEKWFAKTMDVLSLASQNPGGRLVASAPSEAITAVLTLANETLAAIEARKAYMGLSGYGDLLARLRSRLDNPEDAETVAKTIGVLMIDEFQDTDSLQWEIFTKIADRGHLKAFVVVGDPKQAIYSFRGGDVQVYREAVAPDRVNILAGNRRSTGAFVSAANEFFADQDFGFSVGKGAKSPGGVPSELEVAEGHVVRSVSINYHPVRATGTLRDVVDGPGWKFRLVEGGSAEEVQKAAILDLPQYIAAIVGNESLPDLHTAHPRLIRFDDLCVLANSNDQVAKIAAALHQAEVPVSVLGGANIFVSEAAKQWQLVLSAINRPSRVPRARLLARTWFGGASPATIAQCRDDDAWLSGLQSQLLAWHVLFRDSDRFTFFERVIAESRVLPFLRGFDGAERNITDLHHVAELLRGRSTDSLEQLVEFLSKQNTNATGDEDDSDSDVAGGRWSRRIDGDRPAVQVMTIHKSKGLQFPIVLLPYLGDAIRSSQGEVAYRAYDGSQGSTFIDVTASGKSSGKEIKMMLLASEHTRKGYVALTRAQVRNVLWTWNDSGMRTKPLIRTFAQREQLAALSPHFSWDETPGSTAVHRDDATGDRELARSERFLEVPPQRLSYSHLTGQIVSAQVSDSPPDVEFETSEQTVANVASVPRDREDQLRGSTELGLVIHRVLQTISLSRGDRQEVIRASVLDAAAEFGLELNGVQGAPGGASLRQVVALVERSLDGDLGDVAPGTTLSHYGDDRRLPEVGFDFNVRAGVTMPKVVAVLRRHLASDAVFATWLATIDSDDRALLGFMSGSIDAVLATGDERAPRFFVVDYKSNRLTSNDDELYTTLDMTKAMSQHHYQLQGVIYLVALHRYLRSRLGASYDYDTHVAGAAYLFLRGMRPDVAGAGVVHLQPSAACIAELSDLFDGVDNVR